MQFVFPLVFQSLLLAAAPVPAGGPPVPPPQPVTETLHGVEITDPYRFLEDPKSAETLAYAAAETEYTAKLLDRFGGRSILRQRLDELSQIGSLTEVSVGGPYVFYRRREGTENQPILYVRPTDGGAERALIDVNTMSEKGTIALDWYVPSHDGRYLAYGLSPNGSEISTLHVLEVASGKELGEAITPARAAAVAWLADDSGFYYGRPKDGRVAAGKELYDIRIYRHTLGSHVEGDGDPMVFGADDGLAEAEIPEAVVSDDDRFVAYVVTRGESKTDFWLEDRAAKGKPVRITDAREAIYNPQIYKGVLYVLTNDGASHYRLMSADARHPERRNWKEIVPESSAVLTNLDFADGKLLLEYEKDASSLLDSAALDGSHVTPVKLPGQGSIDGVASSWDRKDAYYVYESFGTPQTGFHLDMSDQSVTPWLKVEAPGVDPTGIETSQVFYPSKDGTKIPMFILSKTGTKLDGINPTVLTGYGGFNVSLTPHFSRNAYLWVEKGGVWAVANLRGGGEYGEAWHKAGMLANKQNVFDDFAAGAQYLTQAHWSGPDELAIYGGSNGGLLVGAAITQHPELYRAAVCAVPLLDMLRYQNFEIAKLWIPEYGSAENAEQFKWLYAYSPYQHVVPGTLYPATLFLTADTDSRVAPLHAMKMAALMQEEAKNGRDPDRPILLRVEHDAGHGQGKPRAKQLDESTDVFSFLFWQLGLAP
jgi:prolyl oligopeptidase